MGLNIAILSVRSIGRYHVRNYSKEGNNIFLREQGKVQSEHQIY